MSILYVDTNVFIDAITGRANKHGKDISEAAGKMFYDSIACKYHIAISTWTLRELYRTIDITEAKMLFQMIKNKIITVKHTEEDIEKAKELNPEHFQDALHALLAIKAGAECVVTRNLSDFACTNHLIQAKLPEQL
ncbi:MAG: type II toxin-antitoxin system VapC family toxin [Candidatus Heimdallarchaeaceae archaeon]